MILKSEMKMNMEVFFSLNKNDNLIGYNLDFDFIFLSIFKVFCFLQKSHDDDDYISLDRTIVIIII